MDNRNHENKGGWMSNLIWVCLIVSFLGSCIVGYVWHFKEPFGLLLASYLAYAVLFLCAIAVVLTTVSGMLKRAPKYFFASGLLRWFFSLLIILAMSLYLANYRPFYDQGVCQVKLRNLSVALIDYRQTNGHYPPAEVWCDVILDFVRKNPFRYGEGFRHNLTCPTVSNNQSSYAMNPNANPSSDWLTVLLFECKEGWNRFGGPEIASFENHNEKCFVLLMNGQIISANKETTDELTW